MTTDLERSLAELVGRHAVEQPEAIAIEDGRRRLTYAELDAAAARIAAGLRAVGVEDEEPVGVCLPRSWEAVCAYVGVLRGGGAYVPVNPAYPADRQWRLLELAGVRLALTGEAHGRRLPQSVQRLDAAALALSGTNGSPAASAPGGDRLAYVLFTSGSTGTPKGVEVSHHNVVNLLGSGTDLVPRREDTVLQIVPLEFDVSGLEIWGALLHGARLVIAPRERPDPVRVGRLIAERGVTMLALSTGLFHELVHSALSDLAGLRLCVALGDVLSPQAVAMLRAAHPGVRVLNGYGPTEATIAASSFEVTGAGEGPVPIGRALPGYHLYVLDESGARVADGEPGELWIGGAGVARGYRNDPERTAERFRPDGFQGGTMYRTGDRVRVRADGELIFLGRLDDQVKIDGQRVEPGEVEEVLAGHRDVYEAAVLAREDVPGHKRLVAYAALRRGARASAAELRERLASRLPPYMVPGAIVLLEALPRNERGKVDRARLPEPRRPSPGAAAPVDPGAAAVAGAMAEVLRLPYVGADEDFFELGGTSLLAIQLVGRLRDRLQTPLDVGAVFERRTAAGLAALIAAKGPGTLDLPPLLPGPSAATAPLSAAQRRVWLFGHMHPDSIAYQFAAIFRLEGSLDEAALRRALEELVQRHEILRTSFEERDGEPVQVIHATVRPRLRMVDLREEPAGAWPRLARSAVRSRIDPADAPLVRWTLARLRERFWALLHVEHHLVHDGWSFAVLAGELAELYSAAAEGRPPRLPEPSVQFQDYARWEREAHRTGAVRSQVERLAHHLDPNPPLIELPGARPRPARESFAGGAIRRRVARDLVSRLRSLAGEHGATLFMTTLAAFLVQLHRYGARHDLQIGLGLANRLEPNAERLMGMIVNTVALRCDLGGDPTVAELLARVRDAALDAYTDADAPFDEVVDAVGPRRDPGRSPLIQALFSFHDSPRAPEHWSGLELRLVQGIPNGTAKMDLNVIGIPEAAGGLTFLWEHSDLLDDAAADRMAGHHLRLLEQFAAEPAMRLSELELCDDDERRRIEAARAGAGSYDSEATVHSLVAAQARRDPDGVAVVDGSRRLSYGELLARAGAVAGALRRRGVRRGDRVGVLLERSAESVAAQLGVLAAGAAYVPLDPQHPPARIAAALGDAGAATVLTDAKLRRRLPVGVTILEVAEALRAKPEDPVAVPPDDLAYVIYTSGSTGSPKGVEVTHRNVVRLVDEPGYAELGAGTVMLHAASPAFDAATLELWGPLANGGAVACLAEQPSPDSVARAIEELGVTTLWLTAGLFHELVDRRPDCLSEVRQLLAGGDVLSPDHVRRALRALPPGGRLSNGYGPTETTTFATTHDLRPGDAVDGPIPIGRPIQGTVCYVVDGSGREAPLGVAGELAIGGDGVARGYRGDPGLTAARFRPDPLRPGGHRYLTGDRVRRRADGALEFLGRVDRQVKVRGVRIEPAEVEEALRAHPQVADAAVVPFERAPGDLALAAYFVTAAGAPQLAAEALRAHALARLPAAMVPTAWVTLPSLPLTVNGKLDRNRLPAPGHEHLARTSGGSVRPSGEAERRVVACFEEVLGFSPVGAEDDFFALGGHSLLAVSLFAELERIGGRRLPLATIFEAPTPRALAARLAPGAPTPRWDNLVPLKPNGDRPPLFVVTAGDGNIVGFAPLARRLSQEQPLYALQPNGLDGRRPLDEGIEAMAERYLAALRSVQPHGPYLLAGRCNGATVAYEMAQRLRAAGEEVPFLAALDSDPPPAAPRALAPGIPYDPMMESAWIRARHAGRQAPDPGEPDGPTRLVAWLATPVAPGVSRYLHEAWHWREDLRRAWPEPLAADAHSLAEWGWDHGARELGLVRALLVPQPAGDQPWRERVRRARAVGSRLAGELTTEARRQATDALERRLDRPLPEARERVERRVVAAARRARRRYRAEPWPGRVLLVTSPEFEDKPTYPAWELRARGGVERRLLPIGHVEMLREQGAALLARCLEEGIAEALER